MRKTSPRAIELPQIPDEIKPLEELRLTNDSLHNAIHLTGADLRGVRAARWKLSEVRLSRVVFAESDCVAVSLQDVDIQQCDLASACWRAATWDRVRIAESRMVGFRCNEARLVDLTITGTLAKLAQFRFSEFRSVRFEDCDLEGADFYSADLRKAVFKNCNLNGVEFSAAKLQGADIRGSEIEGVSMQAESMQGMIVEPLQAVQLASAWGLVVKYD
ncbi:MAG: pentapeptide repeat-containing protein [Capsulimonadaceae bacterium]|nr:pentapeptide repeat-containing protein [Capsulimonadaceae bacterium]